MSLPGWYVDALRRDAAELEAFLERTPGLLAAVESEEVQHDIDAHRISWSNVDATIRLHRTLGVGEPWNEWEWPRRVAYHRACYRRQLARLDGPAQLAMAAHAEESE